MLIENKVSGVYIVGDTTFMPGINSLAKADWEKIKAHPHVKHKVEEEQLKILSDKDSTLDAGDSIVHSLKEFAPKQAEAIIKQTFAPGLLKTWKEEEKRPAISRAIRDQLKKIEGEAFEKEKKSEE